MLVAVLSSTGLLAQSGRTTSDANARHVTILQTTDIHDHANGADHVGLDVTALTGTGVSGAYARIASYINHVRLTANHPVVLVDSGDWTMGTIYDLTVTSQPGALFFLQTMQYDCVTLGNHEFDYTSAGLAQILGAGQRAFGFRTPIVATNMNLGGDTDLAPFFGPGKLIQSSHIENLANGLRVGYIGLMGSNAISDIAGAAPVSFWDPAANYSLIQAQVDALRTQGVQLVIALSHSGTDPTGTSGEDVSLAMHVHGINVIASGHTHTPLPHAQTVQNGTWNTYIVDAGWAGSNVSRIDLTYHPATATTTLDASSNPAMTDASLEGMGVILPRDPWMTLAVAGADLEINTGLKSFFAQTFPDYNPLLTGTGIYHPVGAASQTMDPNSSGVVPAPNGLGDLAADSIRAAANSIIAQNLAAVGGNPSNAPGFDFTPVQAAVVPTGALRGSLLSGVPLTFSDIYSIMPLGFTPDSSQALPAGYPLISTYFEPADLEKFCALQLLVQSGLTSSDDYVNLSGVECRLDASETYIYFKYATAAAVLQLTSEKAASSPQAAQALAALTTLASDQGAALLGAYAAGNVYATAMVKLNDSNPGGAQVAQNLGTLGQVAAAAVADSANGTSTLTALIMSTAVAAVNNIGGFARGDGPNIGPATPLPSTGRVRVILDLSTLLLVNAIGSELGVTVAPYAASTGNLVLSASTLPAVLANRVDATPSVPGIQELKAWMALLYYVDTPLNGTITSIYASTSDFSQFATFGSAVRNRSAAYPVASIGQLLLTVEALESAP